MILLSLDEMERLVYAQFLQSLQPIEFNILMAENGNDSITIIYYRKYISYLCNELTNNTDERSRYLANLLLLPLDLEGSG